MNDELKLNANAHAKAKNKAKTKNKLKRKANAKANASLKQGYTKSFHSIFKRSWRERIDRITKMRKIVVQFN